ncbi:MAG: tetratricopeptide repeat protein [Actinomycetota bacterium]
MAEKQEFWTEQRLKTGIYVLIAGIVIIIIAIAGWWYYLNRPEGSTPPVLQRSITEAQAAIKKNPNDINARLTLAQLYIQNKQYNDAIVECKLVIKSSKNNEIAYSLMGIAEDLSGDKKTAITYYKKTIDLGAKKEMSGLNAALIQARFRLGKIYLDQKNYDGALVQFQTLADTNSMDADSRYYLGLTFYDMKQYDKSIEWLEQAVRYVPDYYEAFYKLGQAYEKKGDKAKAIDAYKKALKAKPEYQEAKDALARLEK